MKKNTLILIAFFALVLIICLLYSYFVYYEQEKEKTNTNTTAVQDSNLIQIVCGDGICKEEEKACVSENTQNINGQTINPLDCGYYCPEDCEAGNANLSD